MEITSLIVFAIVRIVPVSVFEVADLVAVGRAVCFTGQASVQEDELIALVVVEAEPTDADRQISQSGPVLIVGVIGLFQS
jgi:hypothetical protein